MDPRVLAHAEEGDGDPLVLMPGGLTGWLSWIPHQQRLRDHHRVVRMQPIHNELGSAGRLGEAGYTAEVERESLRLTLDDMGIDAADCAGWSRGAAVLIGFTVKYPARVRTLALIEPPAYWVVEEHGESFPEHEASQEFVRSLARREVTPDDLADFLALAGVVADADEARAHPNWDMWVPHRQALSWPLQEIDPEHQSLERLASITAPVLLVKGRSAAPWASRVVDLLGEDIPGAEVVELEGGHASHIESLDDFLKGLEDHLH